VKCGKRVHLSGVLRAIRLIRALKRPLILLYVVGIPALPWLAYMVAKNWEVSPWEEAWLTLLVIIHAVFHAWAINEYEKIWGEEE
jgi:hypothetical protein